MYKFEQNTIYLNFLVQVDFKNSVLLNIEKIVVIVCDLLVIEPRQREYKKIKNNLRIDNLKYFKRNLQKSLLFSSYYDKNFSLSMIEELLRKIYIKNLYNMGSA